MLLIMMTMVMMQMPSWLEVPADDAAAAGAAASGDIVIMIITII